jgi:hypothetical protein
MLRSPFSSPSPSLSAPLVAALAGRQTPAWSSLASLARRVHLLSLTCWVQFRRLTRWGRRSTLTAPSAFRVEVRPPSLRHVPSSAWQRALFWLMAPAPQDAAPPLNRLPLVRTEFLGTLADVDSEGAAALRWRIHNAHSLRELWHLRADVFSVVGVAHSEALAEERVTLLNRHFPTRAPRSQFAPI